MLAKRGSFFPRLPLRPGLCLVPRCRIRIVPALTNCPANRFTPSRCPGELRPFTDDPPPFLCTIESTRFRLCCLEDRCHPEGGHPFQPSPRQGTSSPKKGGRPTDPLFLDAPNVAYESPPIQRPRRPRPLCNSAGALAGSCTARPSCTSAPSVSGGGPAKRSCL